jgi:hypothetical protein
MTTKLGEEITLQSGNTLRVQKASFDKANTLTNTIIDRLGGLLGEATSDADIAPILISGLSKIISDSKVQNEIISCFQGCLYNNQNLTKGTFEDVEARKDYIEVLIIVAEGNVKDFLPENPFVMLKTRLSDLATKFQK